MIKSVFPSFIIALCNCWSFHGTYKLEQERVFPQCSNASCKAQDEHDSPNHHEEPHRIQPPQVCDGRNVGENPLEGRHRTRHTQCEESGCISFRIEDLCQEAHSNIRQDGTQINKRNKAAEATNKKTKMCCPWIQRTWINYIFRPMYIQNTTLDRWE